ncbi:hypothetical protein [Nonomuraea basaltis]|uniref:hypothetical protein n=1 Tax=Nonomuraea basaltis TaxID=2495887 RepID=UPI00110C5129|nr:hypothetical protein [Nonomuraea basaltis]TMR94276.1 hypothetical protein EJK15_34870 [Nonomuraea basaltis]
MESSHLRSFTHPVTNFSELAASDARSQLAGLISGKMPAYTWPAFIHEYTHHWCFNTPVGQAMTYLYLRPALRIMDGGADRYSIGLDFLAYDMMRGLLFPLVEGTGQLAEFDVTPNIDGDLYYPPMHETLLLYARNLLSGPEFTNADAETLDFALLAFLLRERTSAHVIKRKASLLAEPLRRSNEPYLGGYLFIKNVWVTLALRDSRLWNAEVFLAFIRQYVFCDMTLVARLLEPDDGRRDRYQAVSNQFNHVWSRLVNGLEQEVLAELVDHVLNGRHSKWSGDLYVDWQSYDGQRERLGAMPVTSDDQELWRRGIDCLVGEAAAFDERADAGDLAEVHRALMWMVAQRDSFCLIHEPVQITVTAKRRLIALLRGAPIYSAPAVDDIDLLPGTYDGTVNGYLLPALSASFVALGIDGRICSISASRQLPEPMRSQVLGYRMNGSQVLDALEELRRMARDHVKEDGVIDTLATCISENVAEWRRGIAAEAATPHLSGEQRSAALAILDKAGFYGVVGTRARLRGLATITLLSSVPISREAAANRFAAARAFHGCEDTYEELVDFVRKRGREILDDPLLFDAGGGLFSTV